MKEDMDTANKYIHADIEPLENGKDKVTITAQGELDDMVDILIDIICAMAGEFGVTAKSIVKVIDDELEEWE
jgi:hypothetical protein